MKGMSDTGQRQRGPRFGLLAAAPRDRKSVGLLAPSGARNLSDTELARRLLEVGGGPAIGLVGPPGFPLPAAADMAALAPDGRQDDASDPRGRGCRVAAKGIIQTRGSLLFLENRLSIGRDQLDLERGFLADFEARLKAQTSKRRPDEALVTTLRDQVEALRARIRVNESLLRDVAEDLRANRAQLARFEGDFRVGGCNRDLLQ